MCDNQECKTCKQMFPKDQFIGNRGQSVLSCSVCREKQKAYDKTRPCRKRDWKGELDRNPDREAKKMQYRNEHHDQFVGYWRKSRGKKIKEMGIDEYHKLSAEQAKKWRERNPEKVKQINKAKIENPIERYKFYKYKAKISGLEFKIEFDDFLKFISNKCHYCGIKEDEWNGVDRKYNNIGYILDNCVSCCTMCNVIKNDINYNLFLEIVIHIVSTFLLGSNFNDYYFYPLAFKNYNSSSYSTYEVRAIKFNINFNITIEDFNEITNKSCYICNKYNSNYHSNGIDRIDNKKEIGYIKSNCLACCGNCNYLKNSYSIYDFINKIYLIWCNINNKKIFYNKDMVNAIIDIKLYREFNRINDGKDYTINLKEPIELIPTKKKVIDKDKIDCIGDNKIYDKDIIIISDKEDQKNKQIRNSNKITKAERKRIFNEKKEKNKQILLDKYSDDNYNKKLSYELALKKAINENNGEQIKKYTDLLSKL